MPRFTLAKSSRSSNIARVVAASAKVQTVGRLHRFSSALEPLEARTMMSATALPAPNELAVAAQAPNSIRVGWADTGKNVVSYDVQRSTNGGAFAQVTQIASRSTLSYVDNTVAPDTTYTYRVRVYGIGSTSANSKTATVATPLVAPSGLTATASSTTRMVLKWKDNDSTATGYHILRSNDGLHYSLLANLTGKSASSYTDNSVTSGEVYTYEVQAFKGSNTSAMASSITPLAVPTSVTAVATGPGSIKVAWTDTDAAAQGYVVLRSTNGAGYTQIESILSSQTTTWTDSSATSNTSYTYEIKASGKGSYSAATAPVAVTTPLVTPGGLAATANSPTSVGLTWADSDPSATQYVLSRSTDGVHFTVLATFASGTATSYTDRTVTSDQSYSYEIAAATASNSSAVSNVTTAVTPLVAPTDLTANSSSGTSVVLSWTDNDPFATGYTIQRSVDGTNFTTIASVTGATSCTFTDSTVSSAHTYYYEVQAIATGATSAASNVVNATFAAPAPASTVSITTRYGDELVVTATGADDSVLVSQNGSTLTIAADGQTAIDPAPAAGLFVYTRGGTDRINISSSVTTRTTLETIDAAVDDINSASTDVSAWIDSTDIFTGAGTVHTVSTFAGGVAKTTGASLADPSDAGTTMHATGSLWGAGPVVSDVNQGGSGDCYFLSSLAAFANEQPSVLEQSAVDMGDGTFVVQFMPGNNPVFVRVSNDVSTYGGGSYVYARPGTDGNLWSPIMEKAFAYFRSGANAYASLDSGWMGEVYADLGVNSTFFNLSNTTASSLYNTLSSALAANKEVTLGTSNNSSLVSGHAYTLVSINVSSNGVVSYVVRNPWGVSGDSLENSQGCATLTYAQMVANFVDCCVAV